MFSHSSERLIESSLSHQRLAILDLGLWLENRKEYMSEIKCLCGSYLVQITSKGVSCLEYSEHFLRVMEEVSELEVGPEREGLSRHLRRQFG